MKSENKNKIMMIAASQMFTAIEKNGSHILMTGRE